MNEFQKQIIQAKKIFHIKTNNDIINCRIARVVNGVLQRSNEADYTKIHEQCYDLFYTLAEIIKNNQHITPFRGYKIFILCLEGLDDLLFFQDTVTNPKEFNYKKYRDIIEKSKPFITNYEEIKIRIPKDPNDHYNEIYFELLNNYNIKKNDVLNLLRIVYNREKKAKVPKRTIKELQYLKDTFYRIVRQGGKEKEMSKEEIKNEIKEIDDNFKDYL